MGQAVYHRVYDGVKPRQNSIGRVGLLAIAASFLLIQINLAARLPVVASQWSFFDEGGATGTTFSASLVHILSSFGTEIFDGAMGSRAGFLITAILTGLLAARLAERLSDKSIAPALTFIWLNTTVLFGASAFLARPQTFTALAVTLAVLAFVELARRPSSHWWVACISGLTMSALSDPRCLVLGAVLVFAPVALKACRRWVLHPGYWLALGIVCLLTYVTLQHYIAGTVTVTMPELVQIATWPQNLVIGTVLLSPAIAVLAFQALRLGFSVRPVVPANALTFAAVAAMLAAAVLSDFDFGLILVILPCLIALTVAVVLKSQVFSINWLSEFATPLAFGSYVFLVAVLNFPANSLVPHIPVIKDIFGWDRVAARLWDAAGGMPMHIITDTPQQAASLTPFFGATRPVHFAAKSPPPDACLSPSLYVTDATLADSVLGKFRNFREVGVVDRHLNGRSMGTYRVYEVAGWVTPACAPRQ